MADNETGSLIPDPEIKSESNDLPTASIIPEENASAPVEGSLMNDTGSLVPDEAVTRLSEGDTGSLVPPEPSAPVHTEPEKIPEKAPESEPAEKKADDGGYTVPPEPDLPVAGVIKKDDEKKEKKPINKKLIAIIAGSVAGVAVLTLLIIFVIVPLIGNLTRGKLDENAKSFFVREKLDGGNYAVYSEDGKPLTGFDYGSAMDFVNGYALVTDPSGENFGIMSAGGKMSVEFGTYSKIQRYGALYDVATESGGHKLITGDNETVAEYSGTLEPFERNDSVLFLKDDKYYYYNAKGEKVLEFDSSDKPTITFEEKKPFYYVTTKKHVYILDLDTNKIYYDQETENFMEVDEYSADFSCVLLNGVNNSKIYGVKFKDAYKEFESDAISIGNKGYIGYSDSVRTNGDCYFYTDKDYDYKLNYHPKHAIMDESFNFVAIAPYYTKQGNTEYDIAILDATHYVKASNNVKTDDYIYQFYSDGKLKNTVRSNSNAYVFDSDVIEGKYCIKVYKANDKGYNDTLYNTYDKDGNLLNSSDHSSVYPLDMFGNRFYDGVSKSVIWDKDYNVKYEGGGLDYDALKALNGKYFINNKKYKYMIDPESGKTLINDGIYKELTYNKQNDMYVGVREDNTTDIIDHDFNVILNLTGKITLEQNHISSRGGSTTELYTLKGEKFYTYE